MDFRGELKASLGWIWSDGAVDDRRLDFLRQFLIGSGDGQAEAVWWDTDRPLPDASSVTLDLAGLLRVVLGDPHYTSFQRIKALLLISDDQSVGELVLGGAVTHTWTEPFGGTNGQLVVPPASPLLLANSGPGWDVTDTSRFLKLAASGGDVTWSMAVIGTTTPASSSGV